jgi:hypothetical protein
MNDDQNQPGFVTKKIREKSKKPGQVARARKEHWPTSLAKVIKKAITISELLTEQDQADNVRVLREAKMATHRIFDPATKQLIEVPDHKTRLAAITLELAYTEGRPVERQVQLSGDFEDLQSLLDAMKHSPAAQESLRRSDYSLQSNPTVATEVPPLKKSD